MVTVKSSEEKKEYYSLQSRERVVLQSPRQRGDNGVHGWAGECGVLDGFLVAFLPKKAKFTECYFG